MITEFDSELVAALSQEIEAKEVQVSEHAEAYFQRIEDWFPIGLNRIDWSKKTPHLHTHVGNGIDRTQKIDAFIQDLRKGDAGLDEEEVVVIGDGVLECAYLMKFSTFTTVSNLFFDLPQHLYVIFLSRQKCLNLTFEDDLFF